MSNRRDNRKTRTAKNFQFTQKAFEQNWKAALSVILDGTFVMDNKGLEFPDIQEIEDLYGPDWRRVTPRTLRIQSWKKLNTVNIMV